MTGADVLIQSLKAQGVDTLTGMPGNQNIHLYDAVLRAVVFAICSSATNRARL